MKRNKFDPLHEREMFDQAADYYDRYRPSYPQELIETIFEETKLKQHSEILEIGSGSGKATELFCNRSLEMTCIDPGKNLVQIGNTRFPTEKFRFVEGRFEEYPLKEKSYDLVFSAQAFHWIPQPEGYEKAARVLKDDGYLALLWNMYLTIENEGDHKLVELSEKYGGLADFLTEDGCEKRMQSIVENIKDSSCFAEPKVYRKLWYVDYTPEDFYGFCLTGNRFLQKSQEEKRAAYEEISQLAREQGGKLHRPYLSVLYLAKKK